MSIHLFVITKFLADVTGGFNSNGIPGITEIAHIVGGIGTLAEYLALAGIFLSGGVWALAHHHGSYRGAGYGKIGVAVSIAAAFLIGAGPAITNFFIHAGQAVH